MLKEREIEKRYCEEEKVQRQSRIGLKKWEKKEQNDGRERSKMMGGKGANDGRKGTMASRAELTERGLHRYEGFNICTNCHDSIFR